MISHQKLNRNDIEHDNSMTGVNNQFFVKYIPLYEGTHRQEVRGPGP